MWWECSECGHLVEHQRRPISCEECGVAGPVYVEADLSAGDELSGENWRDAWLSVGIHRPGEVARTLAFQ